MSYLKIICVILLIIGVFEGYFGHPVSEVIDSDSTNADVYSIYEDKLSNILTFSHPKPEKPTLREIVYYKMVERPYEEAKTERPFTNGHGYQFLDSNPEEKAEVDDNVQQEDDIDDDEEFDLVSDESVSKEVISADNPLLDEVITEGELTTESIPETTIISEDEEIEQKTMELTRKKRDTRYDNIPEAPTLPPLNLDEFPDYIREIISTESPLDEIYDNVEEDDIQVFTNLKENLKNKIDHIFAKLKTNKFEAGKIEDNEGKVKRNAARTYGMSLSGDKGVIWNNLNDPGYKIHVGDSEFADNEDNFPIIEETVTDKNEIYTPSEDTVDSHNSDDLIVVLPNTHGEGFIKDDEVIKEHSEEKYEDKKDSADKEANDGIILKSDDVDCGKEHELINASVTTIKPIRENSVTHDDKEIDVKDDTKPEAYNPEEPKKSQLSMDLEELLNNEQFWTWLSDWTEAYVDAYTKHIQELIKVEVSNEFKQFKTLNHKDKETATLKPTCDETPKTDEKSEEIDVNKPEIDSKEINSDKIIINGKEIPITHTSNIDIADVSNLDLKKNHNNKVHKKFPFLGNKNKTGTEEKENSKIVAGNIYGNSVGSDKVTNVFIFYGNNTDTSGIFSFGPDNTITIDESSKIGFKEEEESDDHTDSSKDSNEDSNGESETGDTVKEDLTTVPITIEHDCAEKDEIAKEEVNIPNQAEDNGQVTEIVSTTAVPIETEDFSVVEQKSEDEIKPTEETSKVEESTEEIGKIDTVEAPVPIENQDIEDDIMQEISKHEIKEDIKPTEVDKVEKAEVKVEEKADDEKISTENLEDKDDLQIIKKGRR